MDYAKLPDEDLEVVRAYSLVGMCAAQFAALEFHLQFSLSYFHMRKELSVETVIFTRNSTLKDKLQLIQELIRLRLQQMPDLAKEGIDIIDEIDKVRTERNLFIHGYWLINSYLVRDGIVRVSDPKWKYDPKTVSYKAMPNRDIQLQYLKDLCAQVGSLIGKLQSYRKRVEEIILAKETKIA